MQKRRLYLNSMVGQFGTAWEEMMDTVEVTLVEKLDIDPESIDTKNLVKCAVVGGIYGFIDGIPLGIMTFGAVSLLKKWIGK